jgi:dihydrofolate synthase/folylpolyglutamate synthase
MLINSKKYIEATNYLYELQKHGIKLGLSNIERLTDLLNRPQDSFRSIHIAGTNGKGSTAIMLASILRESGFNVGVFTSPHLVSFTERIRINGEQISKEEVVFLTGLIRESFAETDLNPTFFEVVTALGFYYFSLKKVDWAVIETGMGGRFDATNILKPDISIITNIDLDHAEYLGDTISDITYEKAGIIKPGIPVITAADKPNTIEQLSSIAKNNNSPFHAYKRDFKGSLISSEFKDLIFEYRGDMSLDNLSLNLSGSHQMANASIAIRAAELLSCKHNNITKKHIRNGLLKASLEGRLEVVSENPFIILDGAHNPAAARRLAISLSELFPEKKKIMVVGAMKDKDIERILKPLVEVSDSMILTRPEGERAATAEELNDKVIHLLKKGGITDQVSVTLTKNADEALQTARRICNDDSIICVTGSFYTTGKMKELLGHKGVLSGLRE